MYIYKCRIRSRAPDVASALRLHVLVGLGGRQARCATVQSAVLASTEQQFIDDHMQATVSMMMCYNSKALSHCSLHMADTVFVHLW